MIWDEVFNSKSSGVCRRLLGGGQWDAAKSAVDAAGQRACRAVGGRPEVP